MSESIDSAISARITDAVTLTATARREFTDAISKLSQSRDEFTRLIADLTTARDEIDALLSTVPGTLSHTSETPADTSAQPVPSSEVEDVDTDDRAAVEQRRDEAVDAAERPVTAPVEAYGDDEAGDEEYVPEQPTEAISGADKKRATGTGRTTGKSRKSATAAQKELELPFEGEDVWTQKDTDVDNILDSIL